MMITRNPNGSITIMKAVHGNRQDLFKMTYYGFTKTECIKRFRKQFKEAEGKTLINKP